MFFKRASLYQTCGFFTLLFSLLAHGCRYYSLCFSGDAMLLTQQGQAVYQSTLGLLFAAVYWLLRGEITVPPVIGLFTTVFLFLSCVLMAELFRLDKKRDIALLSALLVTHENPSPFPTRPICRGRMFTRLPCCLPQRVLTSFCAAAHAPCCPSPSSFSRWGCIKAICPPPQSSSFSFSSAEPLTAQSRRTPFSPDSRHAAASSPR